LQSLIDRRVKGFRQGAYGELAPIAAIRAATSELLGSTPKRLLAAMGGDGP
jgi:hypothetical protein